MTNALRVEYPDLSTDLFKNELKLNGDSLVFTARQDQKGIIEVQSGDGPVTITAGPLDDIIQGGDGDDIIRGGAGNDIIDGGSGADRLSGGDGDDILRISPGDTISTGRGRDIIQYDLTQGFDNKNVAVAVDFTRGEDKVTIINSENPGSPVYDKRTGTVILESKGIVNIGSGLLLSPGDIEVSNSDLPISSIDSSETTVYRFFDPGTGGHLYTSDENEKNFVQQNLENYVYEGETYETVDPLATSETITGTETEVEPEEVYRFFNPSKGVHLYTTNEVERDSIIENLDNFVYEGVKFYAYETEVDDSMPIYRFYEPTLGVHFYTPSEVERDSVIENLDNYNFEGVAYYALPLEMDSDM